MKKNNIINSKILFGFCITELLVLIVLKFISAISAESVEETLIMFSAILINALFMLYIVIKVKKTGKNPIKNLIPLGVFVTLLADCFLVLAYGLSSNGVITFITPEISNMIGFFIFGIVQVIYAVYLGLTKRRLIIRIGFYFSFILIVYALGMLTFDRLIACLSMSQLILNVIYAWINNHKKRSLNLLLFAIGITLFFGCDSFIMLRMLLTPEGFIYSAICFMVWVFYIPSQVVLTLSYLVDCSNE